MIDDSQTAQLSTRAMQAQANEKQSGQAYTLETLFGPKNPDATKHRESTEKRQKRQRAEKAARKANRKK